MITVSKIIIVSGGFDPLHIGHIDYFRRAKKLGDKLLVILNDDGFLMRKKGYIFMSFENRIAIIDELKSVDYLVKAIDTDQTVRETLRMLRRIFKDDELVFANGGDRFRVDSPEKEVCKQLNIEFIDGLGEKIESSSGLVERVRNG